MEAAVQIIGSVFILAPFVLVQLGRLASTHWASLASNLLGSAVLAVDAALTHQWGFLLLEGVWAIVSAMGMVRKFVGRPTAPPSH